jgi:hypothetical protein
MPKYEVSNDTHMLFWLTTRLILEKAWSVWVSSCLPRKMRSHKLKRWVRELQKMNSPVNKQPADWHKPACLIHLHYLKQKLMIINKETLNWNSEPSSLARTKLSLRLSRVQNIPLWPHSLRSSPNPALSCNIYLFLLSSLLTGTKWERRKCWSKEARL